MPSAAHDRFIASMSIGFDEWHDGIGYDLEALDQMEPAELKAVEALLIARKDEDWREIEALAHIGSREALAALAQAARGPNREVRLRAAEKLAAAGQQHNLEDQIVEGLLHADLVIGGLAKAEWLAAEHPSPAVTRALLQGALCSSDGRAVRFVALLYYHAGLAPEPFDFSQRPYFLEFRTDDPAERRRLFESLCERLGVDASRFRCEEAPA